MSVAEHTPTPWRVIKWHGHALTTIVANTDPAEPTKLGNQTVVQYGHTEVAACNGSRRDGGNEANAARIVACVNACTGLADPQRDIATLVQKEIERYELMEVLRSIADAHPSTWALDVRDQFQQWAQNRARAAIAKLEGGAV